MNSSINTKIALFTDAPPLRDGGFGNSAVSFSFAERLAERVVIVLTRRHRWANSPSAIARNLRCDVLVYKDASWVRGLALVAPIARSFLDGILFIFQMGGILGKLKLTKPKRILAICGNDPVFLVQAWILQRFSGIPVDMYLVDDIESSARMEGCPRRAFIYTAMERLLINRFNRLFLISPGYVEHLGKKYNSTATWLPVPIRFDTLKHRPTQSQSTRRVIVFSGSLNRLYIDALRDLCDVLSDLNRNNETTWRLLLLGRSTRSHAIDVLGNYEFIECESQLDNHGLINRLGECTTCFLPYSHSDDVNIQTMVRTAFSCKISEYYASGRPILAYGPPYATNIRYFQQNNIPQIATTKIELRAALQLVDKNDNKETIFKYQNIVDKFHSSAALIRTLEKT